ncbi:hypothetical protein ABH925_007391 [Streptacidiphilus sp. EB129]
MGPAQPEVGRGEGAGCGGVLGVGQQSCGTLRARPGGRGDPGGDLGHGGGVLEPALPAVQVAAVDGAQQPGGVQDVGDPVLAGVGVARGVGQHHRHPELVCQGQGSCGQAQGAGSGAGTAQGDRLQSQAVPEQLVPWCEQLLGQVGAAGGQGAYRLRGRPEQHHQVLVGVGLQGRPGDDRKAPVGVGVGVGDQAAQPGPAGRGARQHGDPQRRLDHMCTTAYRGTAPGQGRGGGQRSDSEVRTEQRAHSGSGARLREPDGTRHGVTVRERQ